MKIHALSLVTFVSACLLPSCSSLRLDNVDFGWPVESVVTVSNANTLEEGRYIVSGRVAALAAEEFQDSTALRGATLRILRNSEGYYFVTGQKFKNVYVFTPGRSELSLKSKIEVSKWGLVNPALNQRGAFVELLDGDTVQKILSSDDIVEGKKK